MKYVFTNGKILNGTKDMQVQEGQVILVENERITELLPAEEAGKRNLKASGYEEIDLQGKYILPGLINMHVHLAGNGKPQKKQRHPAKNSPRKTRSQRSHPAFWVWSC